MARTGIELRLDELRDDLRKGVEGGGVVRPTRVLAVGLHLSREDRTLGGGGAALLLEV